MSVRRSTSKTKSKQPKHRGGTKRYPRKNVRPAKISTYGNVEVEYDKDKSGDHYVANMEFGELNGRYKIYVDLMGYNHENIDSMSVDEHNGMISLIYREKDKDLAEVVIVIRPEKIEEIIIPKKKRFGRFSKSELRYKTKSCGHCCDFNNKNCCLCGGRKNCSQCNDRQAYNRASPKFKAPSIHDVADAGEVLFAIGGDSDDKKKKRKALKQN